MSIIPRLDPDLRPRISDSDQENTPPIVLLLTENNFNKVKWGPDSTKNPRLRKLKF